MEIKILISILVSIIILFFTYSAYNYTKNLEECECVSSLKSNIDRIENIELFLIVMQVIGISTNIIVHLFGFDYKKMKKSSLKIFGILMGIYGIILISILINFIYNVYTFGTNLPSNCGCADKWQKDILYVQAGWYSFTTISAILLLTLLMYRMSSDRIKK